MLDRARKNLKVQKIGSFPNLRGWYGVKRGNTKDCKVRTEQWFSPLGHNPFGKAQIFTLCLITVAKLKL